VKALLVGAKIGNASLHLGSDVAGNHRTRNLNAELNVLDGFGGVFGRLDGLRVDFCHFDRGNSPRNLANRYLDIRNLLERRLLRRRWRQVRRFAGNRLHERQRLSD
jgi:hypothetical protein